MKAGCIHNFTAGIVQFSIRANGQAMSGKGYSVSRNQLPIFVEVYIGVGDNNSVSGDQLSFAVPMDSQEGVLLCIFLGGNTESGGVTEEVCRGDFGEESIALVLAVTQHSNQGAPGFGNCE